MSSTTSHPVLSERSAHLVISKFLDTSIPFESYDIDNPLFVRLFSPYREFIESFYSSIIDNISDYFSDHCDVCFVDNHVFKRIFRLSLYLSVIMPRDLFPSYFNVVLRFFGCPHFSYHEFFPKSSTQPFGYSGRLQAMRYIVIANILESIRGFYDSPLRITSGYRPVKYNSSVNGAKNSYHIRYRAVDFVPVSAEVTADILNNPSSFNQLVQQYKPVEVIFGYNYIHLAF